MIRPKSLIFITVFVIIIMLVLKKLNLKDYSPVVYEKNIEAPKPIIDEQLPAIYFIESSGKSDMDLRYVCAIESAAYRNPVRRVFLYALNETIKEDVGLKEVQRNYENFKVKFLNQTSLFQQTPLYEWHKNNGINASEHPTEQLSDAARLAIVWKNGGAYFDLDVFSLRSIDGVRNSIGMEDIEKLNNGLIIFDQWHFFLYDCMQHYVEKFDPKNYYSVGPGLVAHVALKICREKRLNDVIMKTESCAGVTVHPHESFHPIHGGSKGDLFKANTSISDYEREFNLTTAYTLHMYTSNMRGYVADPGTGSYLEHLSQINCPNIYKLLLKRNKI